MPDSTTCLVCSHSSAPYDLQSWRVDDDVGRPLRSDDFHPSVVFRGHSAYCWGLETLSVPGLSGGPRLISGAEGRAEVFLWDAETGKLRSKLPDAPGYVERIRWFDAWSPNSLFIGAEQMLALMDLERNLILARTPVGHWKGWVTCFAADIPRHLLYVASDDDNDFRVYDSRIGLQQPVSWSQGAFTHGAYGMSVAEEQQSVIFGTGTGALTMYDARNLSQGERCRVNVSHKTRDVYAVEPLGENTFACVCGSQVSVFDSSSEKVVWSALAPGVGVLCGVAVLQRIDEDGMEESQEDEEERLQFAFVSSRFSVTLQISGVSIVESWTWTVFS